MDFIYFLCLNVSYDEDDLMASRYNSNIQLPVDNSLSDFSFFKTKRDAYHIDILNDYIANEDKTKINSFDYNYSYYSNVKKLFEFEPIKILSHPKASAKNQSEKSKNITAKSKLKLPSIELSKTSKVNRLFDKYQSYNKKNKSSNGEQVNQNDLIKNILDFNIYDCRKNTKCVDLSAGLEIPSPSLFDNNSPKYHTPRSTPVFFNNENFHNTHEGYESIKSDDQLLPAVSFRDRYPIYYNLTPAASSDYSIFEKDTALSDEEASLHNFKSRMSTKSNIKKL